MRFAGNSFNYSPDCELAKLAKLLILEKYGLEMLLGYIVHYVIGFEFATRIRV